MLIVTSLAAVFFASTVPAGATAPATWSFPPTAVNVQAAPSVSPTLLTRILTEADAIWRPSGFAFAWKRAARAVVPGSTGSETGPYVPSTLRVVIGNDTTISRDGRTPLGWIVFDDERTPQQEIYLSLANAMELMSASRGVVGLITEMTVVQRETLLARALGRALAHELGHYMLASKVHTSRGLLKATRMASEFFASGAGGFQIDAAQRLAIASRLRGESRAASR
jgi:hypothetical protein